MQARLLSIASTVLFISIVIVPVGVASVSHLPEPPAVDVSPPESRANQGDPASDPLYPADLDPPEACKTSRRGPFGKDVEIFMGGDVGYRVDLVSAWQVGNDFPSAHSASNIAAAAASSENIVAAWRDEESNVWFDLWQTTETHTNGVWVGSADLGFHADGEPIVLIKSEHLWEVYARQGSNIFTTVLTDTAVTNPWVSIPGVNNAASDPVVIPVNPNHTGIFYLDTAGRVWFTEWTGGWNWRDRPIPLVDSWRTYLPAVVAAQAGALRSADPRSTPASGLAVLAETQTFTVLNAIARNENHMAVFAIDAEHQLWVREWARSKIEDWSNTHWVKLMEDVADEKPGVASRHFNHIGLVVRDRMGIPNYIEWTQAGWSSPEPLMGPGETSGLTSGLTLAAVAGDQYWLFGVEINGFVQEISWNEDTGWGQWGLVGDGMVPGQILAVPVRRSMDLLVIGRTLAGEVKNFHFTSTGGQAASTILSPQTGSVYLPRGQALAWVDGSVLQVAGRQSKVGPPYSWEVDVRVMGETDPLVGSLLLPNHDYLVDNIISLAAGDLDFDGSDEAVVATRSADSYFGTNSTAISVLDFGLGSSLDIVRVDSGEIITDSLDISVAIGDLDGNGRRDEIIITAADYSNGVYGYVYRYNPETRKIVMMDQGLLVSNRWNHNETEVATGRLYPRNPDHADPSQQYLGEQIVLLQSDTDFYDQVHNNLRIFSWISGTLEIENVDGISLASSSCAGCSDENRYRAAVDAGDLDGDGFDEVAVWSGSKISAFDPLTRQVETEDYNPVHNPSTGQALSVGDIDLDGRAEVLAGMQQYLSVYEIMGDGKLARTKWQQWDLSWGTANTVLAGDLDHDTFVSELVGCKTFREARIAVVVNGAPRWYENGAPVQNSSGSFSLSKGGSYSQETGTSHSWGSTLEIGYEQSVSVPFVGEIGSFRASVIMDYLTTVGHNTARETEQIYGTDYTFDDSSLGQVILNVRTYTCNYYDLFSPEQPANTSRAMVCSPKQHEKEFHSLDWWLTSGDQGDFEYSWAEVGHRSPGGVHTNSLEETRNYAGSLPVDYRVVYNWAGSDIPLICGDPYPQSVVWWAEDADGYSEGREVSVEETTSVSTGFTTLGYSMDYTSSFGDGRSKGETFGWTDTVGFSAGVTQFYDDPKDPGDNHPCYKIVPYVYQARAETLGGFTYPYLELDYYVVCIGCGG